MTRDKGLLKRGAVARGYWLRQTAPRAQLTEVVAKEVVAERLPPQIRENFEEFGHCTGCEKV